MNKKVVVVHEDGKIVDVLEVRTFTDPEDYNTFIKLAKFNREELKKEREEELQKIRNELKEKTDEFSKCLGMHKLEIDLLRGRIDDEEYEERMNELCGTK